MFIEGILWDVFKRYEVCAESRKHFKAYNDFDMVFVQSAPTSLYYILTAKHFAKDRPVLYNSQDMFPGSAIAMDLCLRNGCRLFFINYRK